MRNRSRRGSMEAIPEDQSQSQSQQKCHQNVIGGKRNPAAGRRGSSDLDSLSQVLPGGLGGLGGGGGGAILVGSGGVAGSGKKGASMPPGTFCYWMKVQVYPPVHFTSF